MAKVFIGVDPHRLSATIELVDRHERVLATGRFGTDKVGNAAMRKHVSSYPDRVWAVEGSNGTGRPWRSGCSPTASTWSTSRPSCRPGRGCSTRATTARPTPTTRTPSPWSPAHQDAAGAGLRRRPRGAADAGRPPRPTVQGEGAVHQPVAPAAVRTGSRTVQDGHHRASSQSDPGRGSPPGPGPVGPQAARPGAARRADGDREEDQGVQQRAQGAGPGPRFAPDGHDRCRPCRRRPDPATGGGNAAEDPLGGLRNQFRNVAPGIPSWSPTW